MSINQVSEISNQSYSNIQENNESTSSWNGKEVSYGSYNNPSSQNQFSANIAIQNNQSPPIVMKKEEKKGKTEVHGDITIQDKGDGKPVVSGSAGIKGQSADGNKHWGGDVTVGSDGEIKVEGSAGIEF